MLDAPAVSVVIPLYNKRPYIARALNSVISQTFKNFDVIVIDDGSIDDGAEIVKGLGDPRIRLIRQENQGVSTARTRGVVESAADFVAFLDADDEWLPKHLETLLRLRKQYPEAGAYGTAYLIKIKELETIGASFSSEIPKEPWEGLLPSYFKAAALGDPPISASTVAISKTVFNKMDGFKKEAWWAEDTDLWGRIALEYPIAFSWDGMGIYHMEASNRAGHRTEPVEENVFVISALNALHAGEVPAEWREDLLEYVASKQIQTACHNLQVGRPDLARRNLMNCKTQYRWKTKYWTLFWTYIPSGVFFALRTMKSKILKIACGG